MYDDLSRPGVDRNLRVAAIDLWNASAIEKPVISATSGRFAGAYARRAPYFTSPRKQQ